MSPISHLLVLASILAFAKGQDLGAGLDACAKGCVDNLAKGGALGCQPGDTSCICAKPDFAFGVRDCAQQACPPNIVAQATNFVSTLCATATLATVTTTPSPAAAAASTTTSTSSTDRPTPSSAPQAKAESSTSTTTSSTTSSPATSTPASTQPNGSASTTTSAAKASSSAVKDKDDDDDNDAVGGLSAGAKAGIGITVAIVGTGLIGLAFWLRRRSQNRNSINTGEFHISGPMPGSGRDYADSHLEYNKEDNTSELELRSRRYEDMLPRQQPASMI